MDETKVTIEHVRQAAEWALTAVNEPQPIDGCVRQYNQITWDCGTSCCIWGAACILAGERAFAGPSPAWEWVDRDDEIEVRIKLRDLMNDPAATPAMFIGLIDAWLEGL